MADTAPKPSHDHEDNHRPRSDIQELTTTTATSLARYSAMWRGALRERLRYRREIQQHSQQKSPKHTENAKNN
jgi:hypothetical protein